MAQGRRQGDEGMGEEMSIPKEKYSIVNKWAAVKVMGWREGYDSRKDSDGCIAAIRFNPCTCLNDCKLVVDRLDGDSWYHGNREKFGIALAQLLGVHQEMEGYSYYGSNKGVPEDELHEIINAPAEIRMTAALRVFFPNMTTEEAINKIEESA